MFFHSASAARSCIECGIQDPLVTIAIQKNAFKVATPLLARAAEPNARHRRGSVPLCHAAISGNPDLVRLFPARGADASLAMPVGATALRQGPEFGRRLRVPHRGLIAMLNAAGAR